MYCICASELSLSLYIYMAIYITLTPSHKSGKKGGKVSGLYAVCRSASIMYRVCPRSTGGSQALGTRLHSILFCMRIRSRCFSGMYVERTMICDVMVNMPSQFMISGNFTALAHCAEIGKPRGRLFVPVCI